MHEAMGMGGAMGTGSGALLYARLLSEGALLIAGVGLLLLAQAIWAMFHEPVGRQAGQADRPRGTPPLARPGAGAPRLAALPDPPTEPQPSARADPPSRSERLLASTVVLPAPSRDLFVEPDPSPALDRSARVRPSLASLSGVQPAPLPAPAAAPPTEARSHGANPGRTLLRWGLGLLWILDGLLQAQPAIPSHFASGVLASNLPQPAPLAGLILRGISLWNAHQVPMAAATVWIQIGIGVAILAGGDRLVGRFALVASLPWAIAVWLVGEAMGGLLRPGAGWLFGSPGAVLFYAGAAVLLLLPPERWRSGALQRALLAGLGALWLLLALLQALPGERWWQGQTLAAPFVTAEGMLPRSLAAPAASAARLAATEPTLVNALVVAVLVLLGAGLLSGRARRAWVGATVVWCLVTWWLTMGFGVLGGLGTDPNAAPLVALLALAAGMGPSPRIAARRLPGPTGRGALAFGGQVFGLAALALGAGLLLAALLPGA